jgi:hypothetical protein
MITIKVTWKYCLAFYCLTMLYASLHELVHHFVGFMVCGDWGYKTFNYFSTACEDSPKTHIATYAGPIFTFSVMWIGAYLLKRKASTIGQRQLAFALIMGMMPAQRMVMPFFKMNDEYHASALFFGKTTEVYWLVILVVWLFCVPPLITAYKSINNKHKIAWFLFYLLLFPYILWGPPFGLLEYLLVYKKVMDGTIIGIANLFILSEVITIAGYMITKKYFNTESNYTQTNTSL